MKSLSLITLLAISIGLTANLSAEDMLPGKIKIFQLKNDVTYFDHSTGKSGPLKRGQTISQNYTIETGPGARLLLIFSNGSRMNIGEQTKLFIARFLQAPFDSKRGGFLTLREDPSKSDTLITLRHGTIVGKVQKLRDDSVYDIETVIGSVGVQDTTYLVTFFKTEDGKYHMNTGNIEGTLNVVSKIQAKLIIDNQNIANFDYDPTAQLIIALIPEKTTVRITAVGEDIGYDMHMLNDIPVAPLELPIQQLLNKPSPIRKKEIPSILARYLEGRKAHLY